MPWLYNLFFGEGVAHSILILSLVISLGIVLGKIRIKGISLGVTWILFVGILSGHFGMSLEPTTLHFMKEFGLILFIFSIGLQVGPGFFSSFKKGGMTLNMLATLIVVLGVAVTCTIHMVTGLPITTMVGILSGAVTNTPGLGAAQQTFEEISGKVDPSIAMGYAVAYPLAVVGIILTIIAIRYLFRVDLKKEEENLHNSGGNEDTEVNYYSLEVNNPSIFGKSIYEVSKCMEREFVISRILHSGGGLEIAFSDTVFRHGDKILVVTTHKEIDAITTFIGRRLKMEHIDWEDETCLISRRIIVTQHELSGKRLGSMQLRSNFGVNVTRVNRAGFDLVATPVLPLQLGDRLTVVGTEAGIAAVEKIMGNSLRRLREPNLITIFLGIVLGVLLGSIPFMLPGIPQPVKLGLAGGPLIVSILLSRFGYKYKLITYTTVSANLMLREVGISIFLACVGLGAGEGFVETIVNGGYMWILYGVAITLIPILVAGSIARLVYKINYFSIMGLLSGAMTDPPALAYSNITAGNDAPAVSYATVYPLTMFLRVISAQLVILFLM